MFYKTIYLTCLWTGTAIDFFIILITLFSFSLFLFQIYIKKKALMHFLFQTTINTNEILSQSIITAKCATAINSDARQYVNMDY